MTIFRDSLLLLPCFLSLLWAFTLLSNLRKNLRSQNIWIAYLLMMSACSIIWVFLFNGVEDYSLYYKLDVIDLACTLSFFPLVYLYFWSLTHARPLTWRQFAWLLPGILLGIASAVLYYRMGDEQAVAYIRELVENADHYHFAAGSLQWFHCLLTVHMFSGLLSLQVIAGMTYATRNMIRYKQGLSHFFSNLEEKSIEHNRAVLIGLYILLALGIVAISLWTISYEHYFAIRHVLMLGVGISIHSMSYHVSRISFDARNIPSETETTEVPPASAAELNDTHQKVLSQLIKLTEEEHIFLLPYLSLEDLARQINTNRTYISHIINTEFGCNFHEYINQKRVDYAQALYLQNPLLTQEELTEKSGFSHSSAFSRIFKKHTGTTYREWQKTVK